MPSAFGDVVILLPGITGSVLARNGKDVWAPSAGGIFRAVFSLGGSIKDLELTADDADDGVTAPRLIGDITVIPGLIKIDGYTKVADYLVEQLQLTRGENFFEFPYDWRRDNRISARQLESKAMDWLQKWRKSSGNANAKLILLGHSMGGLVSRYFLENLGGWQHTRTLVTFGTPHRGSLNAVDFLVNGMKKGAGPFKLDITPLLRSLTSVYQLLPIYRCVDLGGAKDEYIAAAATQGHLAGVDPKRAAAARAFHQEIEDAQKANAADARYREQGYRMVPMVGIDQPTLQSARVRSGVVELLRSLGGSDDAGDGTVPRVSATPVELSDAEDEVYAAEKHGSLQNTDGLLQNVKGVLTRPSSDRLRDLRSSALGVSVALDVEDAFDAGEPVVVRAKPLEGAPALRVSLVNVATGESVVSTDPLGRGSEGWQVGEYDLPPGAYRVTVEGAGKVTPVHDLFLVHEKA